MNAPLIQNDNFTTVFILETVIDFFVLLNFFCGVQNNNMNSFFFLFHILKTDGFIEKILYF